MIETALTVASVSTQGVKCRCGESTCCAITDVCSVVVIPCKERVAGERLLGGWGPGWQGGSPGLCLHLVHSEGHQVPVHLQLTHQPSTPAQTYKQHDQDRLLLHVVWKGTMKWPKHQLCCLQSLWWKGPTWHDAEVGPCVAAGGSRPAWLAKSVAGRAMCTLSAAGVVVQSRPAWLTKYIAGIFWSLGSSVLADSAALYPCTDTCTGECGHSTLHFPPLHRGATNPLVQVRP